MMLLKRWICALAAVVGAFLVTLIFFLIISEDNPPDSFFVCLLLCLIGIPVFAGVTVFKRLSPPKNHRTDELDHEQAKGEKKMGFTDTMKAQAAKIAAQAKDLRVSIKVTSGKSFLGLGSFTDTAIMRQNSDGYIYFDRVNGLFEIINYQWDGPKYKTVATSNTKESKKGKDKTKHKGGLGGAVIGTALAPGLGTAVGYALTRKKEVKKAGDMESNTVSSTDEVEVQTNAKLTFRNIDTGATFVIGFLCDTSIDGELSNFHINSSRIATSDEIEQQKDKVALMKEYKELLDAEIITQEEFDQKKREILGL